MGATWKNDVARSTVGAIATTALVATMIFGGGELNPAVAAPPDNQDSGVEQQLLEVVAGSGTTTESGKAKAEAGRAGPASMPVDAQKPATVQAPAAPEDPVAGKQIASQEPSALERETTQADTTKNKASFEPGVSQGDRSCGAQNGNGLRNPGTLTSDNEPSTDSDCMEIPPPATAVVTTATGATEDIDGTWNVGYTVVVSSNSNAATSYDLTDTLRFGMGLNVIEASWTLQGSDESGSWESPGTAKTDVLAAGRILDPRSSDVYVVNVKVAPEAGAVGSVQATCEDGEKPHDRGFLNEAMLKHNGSTTESRACTTPANNPRGYSMVQTSYPANGETVWPGEDITYTITVKNTGELVRTGTAVANEMAGWQQAATFKDGSLKLSGGKSAIEGSKLIWAVGDLAVGDSATFSYTVTVNAEAWDHILVNVASGNGDVPASAITHPTPEYHKLPELPIIEEPEPPVVVTPPGEEEPSPNLPGKEAQVPPHKPVSPLANTGVSDATLRVIGSGALFLFLGAGFMVLSHRRKGDEN